MAIKPVPSLSLAGWLTSPAEKADALFSHFYLAEKSQTLIYGSSVSSLPWIIEQSANDIVTLVSELRSGIEKYLTPYYDAVNADVSSDDNENNLDGRITLSVHITVTEEGKQYSFGKLLQVTNSKIEKIIALNNFSNTSG